MVTQFKTLADTGSANMRRKAIMSSIREKVKDLGMSSSARRHIGKNPNNVEHKVVKIMRARRRG